MTIDKDGTDLPTHLVGIGASAGGLEALERLFRAMPTDTGMAFVVIQHLSPDFKSLMNELLERFTTMSAIPVIDTENIKPNTIYLLSSRKDLTVEGNLLISHDREKDVALSMPINTFFRSLAASWGERAIAVVLSGTGTDGSHGILDIRDAGGMVLVETPESARFNGMPQSAINTGVADAILPPEAMPKAMQAFVDDPAIRHQLLLGDEDDTNLVGLPAILNLLKHHYKIDFSNYKPATIMRRIGRRVAFLNNGESIEQYSGRLKSDHEELNLLYKDLLIGVTRFFRDPEAFQILRESVIPQIVAQTDLDEEIRVWVCGCSTGEEAYSIAILFLEAIEKIKREPRIKVLATDLHEDSITFAAEGVYSEDKFTDMPLELRKRYFETHGEGVYKVIPNLRKCLIFSAHNILKDPPFTRLHMVSCRNLLIYFQPSAQARTIATLHYSLNLNGIMFLGASETLGDLATEMEIVDRQCKIYRKIKESSTLLNSRSPLSMPDVRGHTSPIPATQLPRLYDNLLEKYVPGGVLVNERREILHIFGDASRYIHASSGRFSTDVLNMVSHPIALALTTALRSAAKHQNPVILKGIHFENEDKTDELLTISVDPFMDKATNDQFFMIRITSELLTSPSELLKEAANFSIDSEAAHQVCELEGELQKMRESLQSTVEELETTNEELQASNEELLASNEELQSTNEELHSVNEELYSVNAEHELKIEELNRTTSDLRNLMQSTDTATIFIDHDGKIRLYTPRALEIFSLFPQDIGRELKHFKSIVPDIELFADIEQIQRDQIPIERHIEWGNEKTYIRRCMVYQNVLGKQQGVVINYIDTSQVTHTSQALYNSESRLRGFMEHTPTIAWVKDAEGRYIFLNAAYEKRFGIKLADWLGKTDAQIWPAEIAQKFRDNDLQVLESGQAIEIEEEVKEANGTLSIWRSFKFLIKDAQNYAYVAGIGIDITERKKVEAQLAESEERLRLFIQNAPVALAMFDAEMRYLAHSKRWLDEYKLTEDVIGQRHYDVFPEIGQDWKNIHQRGLAGETIKCDEQLFVRANGSKQWLRWEVLPWHTANGKVGGILIFTEDITVQIIARQQIEQLNETLEQRVAERTAELEQEKHALQKSEQQLGTALLLAQHFEAMVNSSQDAIISKQLDGTVTSWNKGAEIVFGYSAEEMLGQSVTRLTPPNYEAEEQSILQRIWHGEVIKHYETQHVCKDGRIIDVSVTLSPIRDSEGKIVGASKIARDITAAKAAEAKLRASEMALRDAQKMLRTMIDVVPTMLSRWDKNEICLAANRAYADRFGLPVASLPGKSYRETLGEALYQQKQPYLQQVLAGESVMFESESPRADGRGAHHAIVRYLPDLDNGAVNGFYVEEEDVSEVVEARETAKARAAEFRSLVESVPVSILVSDASGQIVEVNRELERLFGYSHKELIGQSIETLVPEQFHTHHKEYSSTFQKGYEERDKSSRTDLKGRHKDGTLIPVSISIRGLGNTVDRKVVASIVDMRRSKAIETELEQAKQKAEIANQAKSSFLSTMSHEIRTPLNAIIGMSYVLNSGSLSAEQKEEVNSIEVASKALLALINDILDISKIEEGELTLDSHPFSLTELLNDLRLLFTPMVESKGLMLNIAKLDEAIPQVLIADSSRLRQMLINLLNNAIKFTTQGSISLAVTLSDRQAPDNSIWLQFSVKDTGIGIEPKIQDKLFHPFIQADNSTARCFGGTGLGLSIVKRLVDIMQGEIGVESELGTGAIFWFELPFQIAQQTAETQVPYILPRSLQVLIAENNSVERELLMTNTKHFGWNVEVVDNGITMMERVIARLNQQPFDCLIVDGQIPELESLSALSQLKHRFGDAKMPAVIMINPDPHEQHIQAKIPNVIPDSILNKPIDASLLFNCINQAVIAHSFNLDQSINNISVEKTNKLRLDNVNVLVIDDSKMNLQVMQRILSNQGAQPTLCESGDEAIEMLKQYNTFDVVLMDLQMPIRDGYDTTRYIRHQLSLKELPIIALTAGATITEQQNALASGMNHFLTKPIEPERLIWIVWQQAIGYQQKKSPVLPTATQTEASTILDWPEIEGIDSKKAKLLLGGNVDFFAEILQLFIKESLTVVNNIKTLRDSGQVEQIAEVAHKLKGQTANIGATALQEAAKALENVINQDAVDNLNELISTLESAYNKLINSSQKWLATKKTKTDI